MVMVDDLFYNIMFDFPYSWQAAKRKGRGPEMAYCKQFCLSRNTMLDIEVTFLVMFLSKFRPEQHGRHFADDICYYHQTSNISHTLVGNEIVDHSDVVGVSPVGAAPTTSSFFT